MRDFFWYRRWDYHKPFATQNLKLCLQRDGVVLAINYISTTLQISVLAKPSSEMAHITLCCLLFTACVFAAKKTTSSKNFTFCTEVPNNKLEIILGPAYNQHFMSISRPEEEDDGAVKEREKRETLEPHPPFYIDDPNYSREFSDQPAWTVKSFRALSLDMARKKRKAIDFSAETHKEDWKCKRRFSWTDMGPDYFPRFLRNVECVQENCWYHLYKCKPRSLMVRLLKRKRGKCVEVEPGTTVGQYDLPVELMELWVWEERAVRFCCDCQLAMTKL